MKLVPNKQRDAHRGKALRIAISQAEITADLHYPAGSRQVQQATAAGRRVGGR